MRFLSWDDFVCDFAFFSLSWIWHPCFVAFPSPWKNVPFGASVAWISEINHLLSHISCLNKTSRKKVLFAWLEGRIAV